MAEHRRTPDGGNLFDAPFRADKGEAVADLLSLPGARIERIVSTGQATPAGQWLEQDWTEFIALLQGSAGLRIEGESTARALRPGDWLTLPAGTRHRVEWTDANAPTIWLAVHVGEPGKG